LPKGSTTSGGGEVKVTKLTKKIGSTNGKTSTPTGGGKSGGGGGGGGGSKPPKAATKEKPKDYLKRYEDIEAAIDETTNAMNRYSNASSHAFGMTKLALMEKERKQIEKLGSEYQSLYKEAQDYYKLDVAAAKTLDKDSAAALKKLKAKTPSTKVEPPEMKFLKDGTLGNPEEIRQFWTDAANTALIPYNDLLEKQKALLEEIGDVEKVSEGDQKKLDAIAKEMELEKELADAVGAAADAELAKIDKAVETAKKMQEALEKAVENIHNWLAKELEAVQYKMEIRVKINDRDIAIMD
jgi:predicted RNA-binding protein Jag